MTIEEGITYGKEQLEIFGGKHAEFIKMAIHALEMQKKLAEFSGMDICRMKMRRHSTRMMAMYALRGTRAFLTLFSEEVKVKMTDVKFIKICKEVVKNYANEHHFLSSNARQKDVFIVWYCKTLQNWKALAGIYGRDEYFELTYNGDKKELYLDVYKKSENMCLKG